MPDGSAAPLATSTPVRVRGQWILLAVAFAIAFLSGVAGAMGSTTAMGIGFLSALALCAFTGGRAIWLLGRAALQAAPVAGLTWVWILGSGLAAALGGMIAMVAAMGFSRGRQLRRRGQVLLPSVGEGDGWSALDLAPDASSEVRAALAAQWRENGKTEHASVAAFARLTLDLMALGAPPELLADANRDALDEIRHAELCFSLARALDGRAQGPLAFPQARSTGGLSSNRTLALCKLAVDSLVDGALLEGFSARLLAQLAPQCADASAQSLLRELAADEGRHSAHGWDVVAWCLREGGASVAAALHGAARSLPEQVSTALPPAALDGSWERFGIPSQAREAQAYVDSRAHVVARIDGLFSGRRAA
jgi:hypothetical protein